MEHLDSGRLLKELEGFRETRQGRCWVHKIANVLNCLPKRLHGQAKEMLHEMMYADKKSDAEKARKKFSDLYHAKHPKAVAKIEGDWKELTAFFDFPGAHWQHLRTTNPIESAFSTVKLRTRVTKGSGSERAAAAMAFKLLQQSERKWRKINQPEELVRLLDGVEYHDGVVLNRSGNQAGVA